MMTMWPQPSASSPSILLTPRKDAVGMRTQRPEPPVYPRQRRAPGFHRGEDAANPPQKTHQTMLRASAALGRRVALQRLAGAGARRMAGSNALNEHSPVFKRPGSPVKATGHTKLIGETGVVKNADIKTSTESLSNAFCRHRTSIPFAGDYPYVSCEAYIAPNATVVGEVEIGDKSLIWSGAVVRGDEGLVEIGAMCNVLENAVITADCDRTDMSLDTDGTGGRPEGIGGTTKIGSYVTVGPNCVLRACTIEHSVVIGAGSVVCEGALIEAGATVGPGSVVPPGRRVPANEHWAGNPLTFVDSQGDHACEINDQISKDYHDRAQDFKFAVYPLPEPSYSMLHVKAAAAEAAGH